ncbi:hypothetical protein [Nonomuraea sp. B19D2]|uniref:hypothetical protein n=1 Tax=Nonomuraea sp. B19D2 TaxID=3159561 RepID=UPI0032DB9C67
MRRVLVLLVIVLAGCGQAERPYAPQGSASSAPPKSETRPEPTASGPETVTIGGRLRVDIDWPADRDPLLKVITDYYLASRKALVSGSDRYLQDVDFELTAARDTYDWVHRYTEQEKTMKGAARLYNLRVAAVVGGKGAQINACVDESKARLVSTRTGKAVVPQPDWVRTPYLQAALAHRGDDGVWRIRGLRYDMKGCTG